MTLTRVASSRHFCQLPQFVDLLEARSGEVRRCDECGRFWRLWLGARLWEPVGWWESRKLRRAQDSQSTEEDL